MTRQALLLDVGSAASALPALVTITPVYGAWAPAVYAFPAVPVPGSFAAIGLVDAVLLSWDEVPRASYAIERAVDIETPGVGLGPPTHAPVTWAEYTRVDALTLAVPVSGGTIYWWRVRAVVFGRYSAYTAEVMETPTDGSTITVLQASLAQETIERVAADTQVALDAATADVAEAAARAASAAALAQQIVDERDARNAAVAATTLLITQVTDDSILSPDEKPALIRELQAILNERPGILVEAAASEATDEAADFDAAVNTLVSYLASLNTPVAWDNTSGNTAFI